MKTNLIEDLSITTAIPRHTLFRLSEQIQDCIAHTVYEDIREGSHQTEVDVGIGTLYIRREDGMIKYKFIPSKMFEKLINDTVVTQTSPIVDKAEASFREKIEATYKKLL